MEEVWGDPLQTIPSRALVDSKCCQVASRITDAPSTHRGLIDRRSSALTSRTTPKQDLLSDSYLVATKILATSSRILVTIIPINGTKRLAENCAR